MQACRQWLILGRKMVSRGVPPPLRIKAFQFGYFKIALPAYIHIWNIYNYN
jgi:hypothetical protein